MQRWCRGRGAKVVQRKGCKGGAEGVQRGCRGGAEVHHTTRCRAESSRCRDVHVIIRYKILQSTQAKCRGDAEKMQR